MDTHDEIEHAFNGVATVFSDVKKAIKKVRISNYNELTFGHLHINNLRNTLDPLYEHIKGSTEIFMRSENKLDDSSPQGQFLTDGYHSRSRFDCKERRWPSRFDCKERR